MEGWQIGLIIAGSVVGAVVILVAISYGLSYLITESMREVRRMWKETDPDERD